MCGFLEFVRPKEKKKIERSLSLPLSFLFFSLEVIADLATPKEVTTAPEGRPHTVPASSKGKGGLSRRRII